MALPVRTNRRETSTAEKLGSIGLGVVGTILLMIVMFIWVEPDRDAHAAIAPGADEVAVELTDTGCQSNAMLASTARMAMCVSPLRSGDSVEQCLDDAQMMMWMELSGCEARTMPSAPVAMAMIQPK